MHHHDDDAMRLWKTLLATTIREGETFIDENGSACIEISPLYAHLSRSEKAHDPHRLMHENQSWYYPGSDELRAHTLSPGKGMFPYTIGERIVEQIDEYIVPLLKHTPHSRRAILSIWDANKDAHHEKRTVPGIITCDIKIRGKLHIHAHIRSCDLLFGLPANLAQIALIQRHIASKLGHTPGSIHLILTSAHLFDYQTDAIKKILGEQYPKQSPKQ